MSETPSRTQNGAPDIPAEFLPENVAALSDEPSQLQDARWFRSGEPFRSMHRTIRG